MHLTSAFFVYKRVPFFDPTHRGEDCKRYFSIICHLPPEGVSKINNGGVRGGAVWSWAWLLLDLCRRHITTKLGVQGQFPHILSDIALESPESGRLLR